MQGDELKKAKPLRSDSTCVRATRCPPVLWRRQGKRSGKLKREKCANQNPRLDDPRSKSKAHVMLLLNVAGGSACFVEIKNRYSFCPHQVSLNHWIGVVERGDGKCPLRVPASFKKRSVTPTPPNQSLIENHVASENQTGCFFCMHAWV